MRNLLIKDAEEVSLPQLVAQVAQLPSFIELEVDILPTSGIARLKFMRGRPFPRLRVLKMRLGSTELASLTPHLPSLVSLDLIAPGPLNLALQLGARIPRLESLRIQYHYVSVIPADDFLLLASSCSRLRCLEICGSEPRHFRSASSITNATIEMFARYLPMLERLSLKTAPPTELTETAVLKLGYHCTSLAHCQLNAKISLKELVRQGNPNLFPSLRCLHLAPPNSGATNSCPRLQRDLRNMASKLESFEADLAESESEEHAPLPAANRLKKFIQWLT